MNPSGVNLALLLIGGFRSLVEAALIELTRAGYGDVRPIHIIAMRAIATDAHNASELGRRLAVSKQAAAKTIAVLQERGYLTRDTDAHDTRLKRLQVTALGYEVLEKAERIFDGLRTQWERQIGADGLASLEANLTALVGALPVRFDILGLIAKSENITE